MEHTGRWRRMRYGKGKSDIKRGVAVLLIPLCTSTKAQRRDLKCCRSYDHIKGFE